MSPEQDILNWALNNSVAVLVLVWLMWRLDVRLQAVQQSLDKLIAYLQGQNESPNRPIT